MKLFDYDAWRPGSKCAGVSPSVKDGVMQAAFPRTHVDTDNAVHVCAQTPTQPSHISHCQAWVEDCGSVTPMSLDNAVLHECCACILGDGSSEAYGAPNALVTARPRRCKEPMRERWSACTWTSTSSLIVAASNMKSSFLAHY